MWYTLCSCKFYPKRKTGNGIIMYKTKPIMDALNALPEDDEKLQEAFKYLRTQDVETQVYVLESFTRTPNKAGGYSDRYTHVFHHLALYWIAPDGEVLDAALVMNKYLEGEEVDAQLLDAFNAAHEAGIFAISVEHEIPEQYEHEREFANAYLDKAISFLLRHWTAKLMRFPLTYGDARFFYQHMGEDGGVVLSYWHTSEDDFKGVRAI